MRTSSNKISILQRQKMSSSTTLSNRFSFKNGIFYSHDNVDGLTSNIATGSWYSMIWLDKFEQREARPHRTWPGTTDVDQFQSSYFPPQDFAYLLSPHVRESKTVSDCGFQAVDSGFLQLDFSLSQWNLDSGLQSLVGIRIPWTVF